VRLAVIILTLNEERHIARCIDSVKHLASHVLVVDSFSSDRTIALARQCGAVVVQHAWANHASQFNWALEHVPSDADWVLRLDADEVVTDELRRSIRDALRTLPEDVSGVTVNRRIYFLGSWIRHGAVYPMRVLRLFRRGTGRCEPRWVDEHIVVSGRIIHLAGDIADVNLNNVTWWIQKHNGYASREALEVLLAADGSGDVAPAGLARQARRTRWMKANVYARLPLGWRAALYFLYRYILRGGFLDGWPGLVFHVLQGFWYRFLVDVKVLELRNVMRNECLTLAEAAKREYGLDLQSGRQPS
jgi:glycosyltransferase involved in cell wall biosynthesis